MPALSTTSSDRLLRLAQENRIQQLLAEQAELLNDDPVAGGMNGALEDNALEDNALDNALEDNAREAVDDLTNTSLLSAGGLEESECPGLEIQDGEQTPSQMTQLDLARRSVTFNDRIATADGQVIGEQGDAFDDDLEARAVRGPTRDGWFINGGVIDELYYLSSADGDYVHIDDSLAFPPVPAGNPLDGESPLIVAPDDLFTDTVHIKRKSWTDVARPRATRHNNFVMEIYICDLLAKRPHPHIVRYLGVRVRRGLITGLAFEKLPATLRELSREEFQAINKDNFFRALRSAIAHLHHHDLAYNDLKPANIMVRNGLPYLIDFGSTGVAGDRLMGTTFTRGWARPELYAVAAARYPIFSDRRSDAYALDLLWERFSYDGIQRNYA